MSGRIIRIRQRLGGLQRGTLNCGPGGTYDSSLARSAWLAMMNRIRPIGNGMIAIPYALPRGQRWIVRVGLAWQRELKLRSYRPYGTDRAELSDPGTSGQATIMCPSGTVTSKEKHSPIDI
jgi:hypothetical protein